MNTLGFRLRALPLHCAVASLFWVAQAQAQTPPVALPPSLDPGAIQRQSSELQRQLLEEERKRVRGDQPSTPIDQGGIERKDAGPASPAARIMVKQIVFSPSAILSAAELAKIAADYEGKVLGFTDLKALIARVNALYKARGAIAAEGMIPPQDISGGVVTIRLVEGRIGAYHLTGNESTNADYVLGRMHDAPGSLLYIAPLERDLIWFNRSNDAQLKARLQPGAAFGTTDVTLSLEEPPRHGVSLFADNAGSHSTGEFRQGVVYVNHSALGYRDELTLSATRAEGYDGRALSYAFPVNTWGGRFLVAYNDDRTHVKFGPFKSLNISGSAESWSTLFRQPVWVDRRTLVNASLGAVSRRAVTFIEDVQLQRVETLDTSLGIDALRSDEQGSWSGSLSVTAGEAHSPDHLGYNVGRGNLQRNQDLGNDIEGRANLGWQVTSNDRLPSSAQFFLGGAGTVRGYSNALYSGLSGYVLNLELRHALKLDPTTTSRELGVTALGFFDSGQTRPVGPGLTEINLQSVGVGFEVKYGSKLFARLTIGHQLRNRAEESGSYRVDVAMVVVPF